MVPQFCSRVRQFRALVMVACDASPLLAEDGPEGRPNATWSGRRPLKATPVPLLVRNPSISIRLAPTSMSTEPSAKPVWLYGEYSAPLL
ncbi:hypothetical protein D3C71_1809250 [compost metagenome]